MLQRCTDNHSTTFSMLADMIAYHYQLNLDSRWERTEVNTLQVEPLTKTSALFGNPSAFAPDVTVEAIEDTAERLGLAIKWDGQFYPLRETAFKGLLDRAKISGTVLPKLKKEDLAYILNACLQQHSVSALLLVRDQKVSAAHSGDERDYSILPINELLDCISHTLQERFPGNEFESGYTDHSYSFATWSFPAQCEDLLGTYKKTLEGMGRKALASKIVPGIRFCTSDTGVSSAKVSALLFGMPAPVLIGGILEVQHRHQTKVDTFKDNLDLLFSQFGDTIKKLEKLAGINLDYPVNAMTAICKKLSLPKKAALEAITMFETAIGTAPATAHDVYMALQEIIFILKTEKVSEGKMLVIEENLSRALSLRWSDFDLARKVEY